MSVPRAAWWATSFLLAMLTSGSAMAQARLVVLDFEGPQAARLRSEVVTALSEENVVLVGKKEAEDAAQAAGADVHTAEGRVRVARALNVAAFVEGSSEKSGSRVTLTVRIFNGADGALLGETDLSAKRARVRKRVRRRLWKTVGDWIGSAEAPSAEQEREPEAEAETPSEDEEDEDDGTLSATLDAEYELGDVETSDRKLHAFDLGVGLRFMARSYSYKDPVLDLADYSIGPNPAVAAHAHWYPAAHFTQGPAAWFGLDLAFTLLVAPDSERDGQSYATSAKAYRVGLRARVPLGEHELALAVGYAGQSFSVDDAEDGTSSGLPKVSYGFLRVGPELRIALTSSLAVELEVAYLHGLKYGNLASVRWFPHTSGMGLDAGLRVAWAPHDVFELFGGATLRQIGLKFSPERDDAGAQLGRVAGGATDRYIAPEVGVRLRI